MDKHRTLFVTHRGLRHQQDALDAAPDELDIVMLRDPGKAELLQHLSDAEFLISERSGVIDADMIAAGKKLRLIQRLGSQTWDLDVAAACNFGVPVCYWPVWTTIMVAEHMIFQILAVLKRAKEMMYIAEEADDWGKPPKLCDEDYFAYNWSERENIKGLYHSTVGILGFGEIGVEMVRRLKPYGCTVLYNKRSRLPEGAERGLELEYASKEEVLQRSDVVCSLLPYYPETVLSLDAKFFQSMKEGSFFVHCGAGGVIDEDALIEAIRSDHLGGAALDTFNWEPIRPDDPLLELACDPMVNLILTPHVAAGSPSAEHGRKSDYTNLLAVLQGKPLKFQL